MDAPEERIAGGAHGNDRRGMRGAHDFLEKRPRGSVNRVEEDPDPRSVQARAEALAGERKARAEAERLRAALAETEERYLRTGSLLGERAQELPWPK